MVMRHNNREAEMEILDTTATGEGLIERMLVRPGDPAQHEDAQSALRAAIKSARRYDAHVHREDDEHSASWCYAVCDDSACVSAR